MIEQYWENIRTAPPWLVVVLVLIAIAITLIPTFVAIARRHSHIRLVLIANILLSWTWIGWLGVLGWAATDVKSERLEKFLARFQKNGTRKDDQAD